MEFETIEIIGIEIPPAALFMILSVAGIFFAIGMDAAANQARSRSSSAHKMTRWNSREGRLAFIMAFVFFGALDYYVEQPGNVIVKILYQEDIVEYEDAATTGHLLIFLAALVIIGAFLAGPGINALTDPQLRPMAMVMILLAIGSMIMGYMFFGELVTELGNEVWPVNKQLA